MVNRHHADTALFAVFSKCHEHTATSFNAAPVRESFDRRTGFCQSATIVLWKFAV